MSKKQNSRQMCKKVVQGAYIEKETRTRSVKMAELVEKCKNMSVYSVDICIMKLYNIFIKLYITVIGAERRGKKY